MEPFAVFSLQLGSYPCLTILYLCGGLESDGHASLLWCGISYGSKSFIETGHFAASSVMKKKMFLTLTPVGQLSRPPNKVERFNDTVLGMRYHCETDYGHCIIKDLTVVINPTLCHSRLHLWLQIID